MAKRSSRVYSTLICKRCGLHMSIPRRNSQKRPEGHIKTMYCGICKSIQDFVEDNMRTMADKEAEEKWGYNPYQE